MRKKLGAYLVLFMLLLLGTFPCSAWASYLGDFAKAGIDVSGNTLTVTNPRNWKVGNGTPTVTMNGEDCYVEGTFEVDGASRFDGAVVFSSTFSLAGGLTLDDGSGASPSLTFTDATDETAVFSKADAGFISLTTVAGDGFNLLTGNLKVGNGTPGVTQNGEDAYIEGTLEVDGAVTFDGTLTGAGNVTLDDGSGASPSLTFTDATDETAIFSKADAGFLTITTVAGDGFGVTTGNLMVGNGTPDVTQNGEDAYIEGTFEVDGAATFDGSITANSTIAITGTAAETITITRTLTDHTAENAVALSVTAADTTSAVTTQFGLSLTNEASTEGLDAAIAITNADADDAVDDVIRVVDGGGGFTNYFYASQFKVSGLGVMTLANSETIGNSTDGEIGIATNTANADTLALKPATGGAGTFKGTITSAELLADRTWTIPDTTGTVDMNCTASHDYAAGAADWTLTAAEAACSYISVTNANGGVNAILPAATPGKIYTISNGSGQVLTFKVTGQTGGTIASTKVGVYTTLATDVHEIYEQS